MAGSLQASFMNQRSFGPTTPYLTNLGGLFLPPYVMANVNDGILETSNGSNIGYVPSPNRYEGYGGYFDIYFDLITPQVKTTYAIAPQGTQNAVVYNTPTSFYVLVANDLNSWSLIASFSNITTGYPNWNAGSYRYFTFANTTAYRYYRLSNIAYGAEGNGVSISEWALS
jgi:hypothetical protein